MSKTLPGAYATHVAGEATTLAYALKITRADAQVYGFTSHDVTVPIDGVTYSATQGLLVSEIVTTAGLGVDNLELRTLDDGSLFTHEQVLGGLWNNAAFLCFRYNWAAPADGVENLIAGTIGNVQLLQGEVVAELRGLQQYLQQPVGAASSRTCRARLGDSRCTVALGPFTHNGTVTAVASRQGFTAAGLAQAADYFGEGEVTWLTGANAGLRMRVKAHAGGGVFTLALPMAADIQVGDTFTAVAGCRKRLTEDCKTKFNNVLNFVGEPHRPGIDALTATPVIAA